MREATGRKWQFEDLDVFKRAYRLSLEVHRVSLGFPREEQFGGLADQLRRSSKAICALIAEGSGRQRTSAAEFKRYLAMALGSADESRLWCRYAHDLGYVDETTGAAWRDGFQEVARMLQGFIARLERDG